MALLGTLFAKIGADTTEFDRKMKGSSESLTKFGKAWTMKVTGPIVAGGALAIKTFMDFEQSIANAASVSTSATGDFAENMERMGNIARAMGKETAFSAKQAADGLYFMASAGWDVNQMAKAIKPTLQLAGATQSDLAFTTEAVVSALNMFNLKSEDATRVTDAFANTIGGSQATLDRLKTSMQYIGPVASSLGWSIEETSAALGKLYDNGIDASTAGSSLRMALIKLATPTKTSYEALEKLGITADQVDPRMNSLSDILRTLEGTTIDVKDAAQLFGTRAATAMLKLVDVGGGAIDEFTGKIKQSGTTSIMYERQMSTLKGQFALMWSAVQELAIQLGQKLAPAVANIVNKIRDAVTWFGGLNDGVKKQIMSFVGFLALLGPISLAVGVLGKALIALRVTISGLGASVTGLGGVLGKIVPIAAAAFAGWKIGELISDITGLTDASMQLRGEWHATTMEQTQSTNDLINAQRTLRDDYGLSTRRLQELLTQYDTYGDILAAIEDGTLDLQMTETALNRHREEGIAAAEDLANATELLRNEYGQSTMQIDYLLRTYGSYEGILAALEDGTLDLQRTEESLNREFEEAIQKAQEESDALRETQEVTEAYNTAVEAAVEQVEDLNQILDELNTDTLPDGEERVGALESELDQLGRQFADGEISLEEYQEALEDAAKRTEDLKTESERMQQVMDSLRGDTIPDKTKRIEELKAALDLLDQEYADGVIDIAQYETGVKKAKDEIAKLSEQIIETALPTARDVHDIWKTVPATMDDVGEAFVKTAAVSEEEAEAIAAHAEMVKEKWQAAGLMIFQAFSDMWQDLAEGAEVGTEEVIDTLSDMIGSIVGMVSEIPIIGEFVGGVLSFIANGFAEYFEESTIAADNAKKVFDAQKEYLEEWGDDIIDALDVSYAATRLLEAFQKVQDEMDALTARELNAHLNQLGSQFLDLIKRAEELGAEGTKNMVEFILAVRDSGLEIAEVTEYVQEQLGRIPAAFANLGMAAEDAAYIASLTFDSMLASGMPFLEVVKLMSPALTDLKEKYEEQGIVADAALQRLFDIAEVTEANEELFTALDANNEIMQALGNSGWMTQEALTSLAGNAFNIYHGLIDAGLASDDALRAMAPTLQNIVNYADAYGLELDDQVQALIDQAMAMGLVTEAVEDEFEQRDRLAREERDAMREGFDELVTVIKEAFSQAFGVIFDDVDDRMGESADRFTTRWDGAAGDAANNIKDHMYGVANDMDYILGETISELGDYMGDTFSDIPVGVTGGTVSAQGGGYFPRPRNVHLGEIPEFVMNVPQVRSLIESVAGGGGGGNMNVTIHAIDAESVDRFFQGKGKDALLKMVRGNVGGITREIAIETEKY